MGELEDIERLDWVSRWLGLTEPGAEVLFDPGAWLDLADYCAEASSSPGGKEENTGSASKLSDRLTMGSVEVTSIDPVQGSRPQIPQPLAQFLGEELRAIVGSNLLRDQGTDKIRVEIHAKSRAS